MEPDDKGNLRSACPILTALAFVLVIGGFFLLNLIITPPEISQSERRALASMPELTLDSLTSAQFMGGFEDFAADSFTGRDALRTLRAVAVFDVFRQLDKSGLYYGAAGAGKFEKINEASLAQIAAKIQKMGTQLPGAKLYYSFVPDKSIYAGRYYPGFDAGAARAVLAQTLEAPGSGFSYIDLVGALEAGDFYRTDLHWDQSQLAGVTAALGAVMGFDSGGAWSSLETATDLGPFQGVYSGQLALPLPPDRLKICQSTLEGEISPLKITAQYLDPQTGSMSPGPVYHEEALSGRDPYDVFLGGAQPLIILENPEAESGRELYLFRDSFSSSLGPLLTPYYQRIYLIDLRYMDSRILPQFVEVKPGSDALFLYSSQILNNATTLLVN